MCHSYTKIAQTIRVNKSTTGREIARKRGKMGNRPKQAHQFAIERRDQSKRRLTTALREMIDRLIKLDWNPEQISDYLSKEQRLRISHEWIFQHIYRNKRNGGILWKRLSCQEKRRKRDGGYEKRRVRILLT